MTRCFFCSLECIHRGPLVLSGNLTVLVNLLTKTVLKAYMRLKSIMVVGTDGKDSNKSELVERFFLYRDEVLNSLGMNRECCQKTVNDDCRLLNILFSEQVFDIFMSSGDTKTRADMEGGNVDFWDIISQEFPQKSKHCEIISHESIFPPFIHPILKIISMELSYQEQKKNLNTLIVDRNQRAIQMFDKQQSLISEVQTQHDSDKDILKLENKIGVFEKIISDTTIPIQKRCSLKTLKILGLYCLICQINS